MKTEKNYGLRVPLDQTEKIRKKLLNNNLLRTDLKIKKEKKFIYLPLKQKLKNSEIKEFEKREKKPESYKDKIYLPTSLMDKLPTSYDILGDIILVKLQDELQPYKREIGKSLLNSNKNIKTVCLTREVSGELRTRDVEIIAGEKKTHTVHKEYGLKIELDVKKTYFSPRLADERRRIADLVESDEIVLDMFSGVAPFSIMIAKYADPKIVYAIDKNSEAVNYARINIKKNNVLDKVEVIHADSKNVPRILDKKMDRVIMNLPFSAYLFFPQVIKMIADESIVHYYDILEEKQIGKRLEKIKNISEKEQVFLTDLSVRKIKSYSPREFYIGVDITANKKIS